MPSLAMKQAMYTRTSSDALFSLMDINHVQLAGSILRIVNNTEPIVSNGNTYTPAPFGFRAPKRGGSEPIRPQLVIFDHTRAVTELLETITPAEITSTVSLVRSGAPNIIEVSYPSLRWAEITFDESPVLQVGLELQYDLSGVFPALRFDLTNFPGLF
jgi:hypothetical protein